MKVGDQYVIEVTEVINDKLCRIKGFNTLVFDQNGLDKLERFSVEVQKYYTKGYKDGFKDGKELNKKINETFCLGDEVIVEHQPVIITYAGENNYYRGFTCDGSMCSFLSSAAQKTGKNYADVSTFLNSK